MPSTPPTTDDLVALLRARGQRVTSQRLVILGTLRRVDRHLTAQQVYDHVRAELPGTSAPTIYATLELLAELGLARRIDAGLGAVLYDARPDPHHHTVCRRCGTVSDLDGDLDLTPIRALTRAEGFHLERSELVLTGLCAECAASDGGAASSAVSRSR